MKKGLVALLITLSLLIPLASAEIKDWRVQLDSSSSCNCSIFYGGINYKFALSESKMLNKGAGACLMLTPNRYWLKVKPDQECISNTYTVSCDQDFTASIFYVEQNVYVVPFDPFSQLANGVVDLIIPTDLPALPSSSNLSECENNGYSCSFSCPFGDEMNYSCDSGTCCKPEEIIICLTMDDCSKPECLGKDVSDAEGNSVKCEKQIPAPNLQSCQNLSGTECLQDETCLEGVTESSDSERCCIGTCVKEEKTCGEQGGIFCQNSDGCSGTKVISKDAPSQEYCCLGACEKPSSLWTWAIILLILAIIAAVVYYFYSHFGNKKEAPESKSQPFQSLESHTLSQLQSNPSLKQKKAEPDDTMSRLKSYSEKK